jgi:hypothetical protein
MNQRKKEKQIKNEDNFFSSSFSEQNFSEVVRQSCLLNNEFCLQVMLLLETVSFTSLKRYVPDWSNGKN